MTQPTQLDSCAELDGNSPVLPVAEDKGSEPLAKKPRQEGNLAQQKDIIKWLSCPSGDGLLPFVMNGRSKVVHCGRDEMILERTLTANGQASAVLCVKGCVPRCGGAGGECTCSCHILRAHYLSRVPIPLAN